MEEMIIRNLLVPAMSSNISRIATNNTTLSQIKTNNGIDFVMKEVFGEKESFLSLYEEYHCFLTKKKSRWFSKMYRLSEKIGVVLDSHITLYAIPDKALLDEQHMLFDWTYIIGSHYLGDTWWFSDKEILDDIQRLTTFEFIEKYRGIGM